MFRLSIGIFMAVASASAYGEIAPGRGVSTSFLMFQTIFGLVLVLGCIFFLAWAAKKLNITQVGGNKRFSIVASLALSSKEKAVLIQAGDQQILLGVAPGCVSQLQVFDEVIVDPHKSTTNNKPSLAASTETEFSKKLTDFIGQGKRS